MGNRVEQPRFETHHSPPSSHEIENGTSLSTVSIFTLKVYLFVPLRCEFLPQEKHRTTQKSEFPRTHFENMRGLTVWYHSFQSCLLLVCT